MRIFAAIFAFALCGGSAFAQGAPRALYNKSIILTFGLAQHLKAPDGRTINPGFSREIHIYVSSAGRLFNKSTGSSSGTRTVQTRQRGPGETPAGGTGWRFSGNQMVGQVGLVSGANQVVATFDGNFASCTLAVTFGKENGKAIRLKGIDGVEYEVISMNVVHPSCKIQDGNVFAR